MGSLLAPKDANKSGSFGGEGSTAVSLRLLAGGVKNEQSGSESIARLVYKSERRGRSNTMALKNV